ncbi:MAG: glycosyltransferase [Saprospiraceae bacterium]|jgi:glycosyltransferase involved in cell wall biosynthesis|nr:glycosyltransferase [Saprospiraceae bacterium]
MLDFQLQNQIEFFQYNKHEKALFSILIPSWKNYSHLKLVIESIRKNSRYEHQICVHLNEADEKSKNLLDLLKISHSISVENTGVCFGFNAASSLAQCEYFVLIDDDMYLAPDWDKWMHDSIIKHKNPYWCISGTMMERTGKSNKSVINCKNFGANPEEFQEQQFLDEYSTYDYHDWSGSLWYPLALDRKIWMLIGGLSTEFSPGMYSDPDFMMKLWQAGVRHFIGLEKCRVYHFMSKSTSRVKKNDGRKQFLQKWKISNSIFSKYFLRLGEKYTGDILIPNLTKVKLRLFKDQLKRKLNL